MAVLERVQCETTPGQVKLDEKCFDCGLLGIRRGDAGRGRGSGRRSKKKRRCSLLHRVLGGPEGLGTGSTGSRGPGNRLRPGWAPRSLAQAARSGEVVK